MTFCGGATRAKEGIEVNGGRGWESEGDETWVADDWDCECECEWLDLSELRDLRRAFMVRGK